MVTDRSPTRRVCCAGVVVAELGGRRETGEHLELRLLELPAGPAGLGDVLDLAEELRRPRRASSRIVVSATLRLDDPTAAVQVALLEALRLGRCRSAARR